MKSKSITLLALLQVAAVIYAMMATAMLCKLGKLSLENGLPAPSAFAWALAFRDLGILLFIPVVIWTILTAISNSSPTHESISWRVLILSGWSMAVLIAAIATFFALCALTPLIRL